jgi:ATP-binding cassette subfamily B protein
MDLKQILQRLSLEFHELHLWSSSRARPVTSMPSASCLIPASTSSSRAACTWCSSPWRLDRLEGGVVLFGSLVPLGFLIRWFQVRSQKAFRRDARHPRALIVQFVRDNDRDPRGERSAGGAMRPSSRVTVGGLSSLNLRTIKLFGCSTPVLCSSAMSRSRWYCWSVDCGWPVEGLAIGVLLRRCFIRDRFAPAQEMACSATPTSRLAALEKISGVLGAAECCRIPRARSTSGRRRASWGGFEGVEFAYTADRVILPTFDLDIPAGQTIALVGSTRCERLDPGEAHLAVLRSTRTASSRSTVSTCADCIRRTYGVRS